MRRVKPSTPDAEKRLLLLLPLSFALTILSFVFATIVSEYRIRRVEDEAKSISQTAVPAIHHLSRARTELRHMEVLLGDYVEKTVLHENGRELRQKFESSRDSFEREWNAYVAFPPYPGEREHWASILTTRAELQTAVDRLLRELPDRDARTVQAMLDRETRPLVDRLDDRLQEVADLNGQNAAELGTKIAASVTSARSFAIVLDAFSVLLAILAGYAVARTRRRYLSSLKFRVSELQHFSGRVAHDIRSPLSSVALALDAATRGTFDAAKTRSMLERASRTLQRVGQLVDGLLVFARAGATPTDRAHAEVKGVLDDIIQEMTPAAEEKQVELEIERSHPCVVACSEGVLTSLLSNLVGNAIKYMGDSPVRRVTIRVLDGRSKARIEVQDTGPGIDSEHRARIFDPYVRAAGAAIPGLGLGLATVRRLVDAHGGAVGMQATEPGTVFWVELPKAPVPSPAP